MNAMSERKKVAKRDCPLFLWIIITCPAPTYASHGTSDAFSTGSHAQNPPKESASYAQAPPMRTPVPSTMMPKNVQGRAGRCHSVYFFFHSPAIANANGTTVDANPRKSVGGWITIQ